MKTTTVGKKLFFSVLAIFLVFAVCFIVFQQARERQYKIGILDTRLGDFNQRLATFIQDDSIFSEASFQAKYDVLKAQCAKLGYRDLRVTIVGKGGNVLFDNTRRDFANLPNHSSRPEIRTALRDGHGTSVGRYSNTLKHDFFYSATYFPKKNIIIRSALPYNHDLARSLQLDQHFIWFALVVFIILGVLLYRFVDRLGTNINKLKIFASRADHNESLDTDDLAEFPNDELGEIAERIIKIYKRLQSTRQEQDILKRQLTQNIAHELKTPVASIQGYLETIMENPHIDSATKDQFLSRCYAQSERLTALLRDISTLNRLDDASDMQRQSFDNVNISEIVQNIQKETALQLKEHHMTVHNQLPGELIVKGNSSLLYSVFRNLTDNAIAYAGDGTEITISARGHEDYWTFNFSDNGVGVPEEHLPRLFERFYRVDKGRSRKLGGTGLGLAIVKNAILLHRGTIRVKNNPTGGLCFTFTIAV
jgi:signal transduction histidine kinase